jgi:hypothetical protein
LFYTINKTALGASADASADTSINKAAFGDLAHDFGRS